MMNGKLATVLAALMLACNAMEVRLYSSDPARDCLGTTTAICTDVIYGECCNRGTTPVYRTVLCTGMDSGTDIPDLCIAFAANSFGESCGCFCGGGGGTTSYCVACDGVSGLPIKGGAIFFVRPALQGADENEFKCTNAKEPDVGIIGNHQFAIGPKRGTPDAVTELFWDLFNRGATYEEVPAELLAYEDNSLVPPVNETALLEANKPQIVRDRNIKRQTVPPQC